MTLPEHSESARETIILVHGTFAEPRSGGSRQWYQPGSEFCRDLDARLEQLHCRARCWAHLTDDRSYFFWSGRNDWAARSAGATELAKLMHSLIDDGWRVHVVAHSHGGNVLLEALDIGAEGFASAHDYEGGYLVLMGTPIMELRELAKSGMSARTLLWKVLLSVAILVMVVWRAWPASDRFVHQTSGAIVGGDPTVEAVILALFLALVFLTILYLARLLIYRVAGVQSSAGSTAQSEHVFIRFRDALSPQWKRLLILNGSSDEAYQVLSKLAGMVPTLLKPAAAERGSFRHWLTGVTSLSHFADQVSFGKRRGGFSGWTLLFWGFQVLAFVTVLLIGVAVALLVDQTVGVAIISILIAATVLSLFGRDLLAFLCIPARIFSFLINIMLSAVRNLVTWGFRRWGGSVLHDIILGVSGFPLGGKNEVSFEPRFVGTDFYEFRDLPNTVIEQTLESRSKDVVSWLDALTRLLSDQVIAANDALPILSRIANDTTLIHASYYQHDLCRQHIAEWLARDLGTLNAEANEHQLF
jgi:hypothetical protein